MVDRDVEDWPVELMSALAIPDKLKRNNELKVWIARNDVQRAIKRFVRSFANDSYNIDDLIQDCCEKLIKELMEKELRLRSTSTWSAAAWVKTVCVRTSLGKSAAEEKSPTFAVDDVNVESIAKVEVPQEEGQFENLAKFNEEFFAFCMARINDVQRTGRPPFVGWQSVLEAFVKDLHTQGQLLVCLIPNSLLRNQYLRGARKRLLMEFEGLSQNTQFEFCKNRLMSFSSKWLESGANPIVELREAKNEYLA